MHLDQDSRRCH